MLWPFLSYIDFLKKKTVCKDKETKINFKVKICRILKLKTLFQKFQGRSDGLFVDDQVSLNDCGRTNQRKTNQIKSVCVSDGIKE